MDSFVGCHALYGVCQHRIGHKIQMPILKLISKYIVSLVIVGILAWIFIFNWSFVFKKKIVGEVVSVENANTAVAVVQGSPGPLNPQVFSVSVAIKDLHSGEIFMASSEDRKWIATQKGNCVVAAFYPYPPWRIDKGTTDHNARLLKNYESCAQLPDQSGAWNAIKFFFLWM